MLPLRDNLPTRTVPFVNCGLILVERRSLLAEGDHPARDLTFQRTDLRREEAVEVEGIALGNGERGALVPARRAQEIEAVQRHRFRSRRGHGKRSLG